MSKLETPSTPVDDCVRERYSAASQQTEAALCCPITYDPKHLEVIPAEVIERDYGCGDPSPYVRAGDTVVDLGSGGGKLCFIISQLVGSSGSVIGVDINPDMLELARRVQPEVAQKIGYDNIQFRCGRIQDLAIDHDRLAEKLDSMNLSGTSGAMQLINLPTEMRREAPMIADNSVDCVVSNCVLNLVDPGDRQQMFDEIFRVLKPGGRAAISDIVSDEDVPVAMQNDAELWSGCISGAWREDLFLDEFANAGFVGMVVDKRDDEPWQVVNGIEFRSVTIVATKPEDEVCLDCNQGVIYRGPFSSAIDDEGHVFPRGVRMAVGDRTFRLLQQPPYQNQFYFIEPQKSVPPESAMEFDSTTNRERSPRESKGLSFNLTVRPAPGGNDCCGGSGENCC